MRTFVITSFITVICLALSFAFEDKPAMSVSAGAPVSRTGSPGDGMTCMDQCHGANPGTPNGNEAITLIGLPIEGYVPGQVYNLTLAATGSSNDIFGFEISPQDWTGEMRGSWITGGSNLVQILNTKWMTHTFAGNSGSGGARSWDFQWEAPSLGTGDVNFYFTSIFADGMNAHLGDVMLQDSVMIMENNGVSITEPTTEVTVSLNSLEKVININNPIRLVFNVQVLSLDGRLVHNANVSGLESKIDLASHAQNGVYLVVIRGEGFMQTLRVALLK